MRTSPLRLAAPTSRRLELHSTTWHWGQEEIVNADGVRGIGQQALAGTAFLVGIGQADPQKDPAVFDDPLKVTRMAGHEPKRQRVIQASCARTDPISKAVGERTGGAADKLAVLGECQLLNGHRFLRRRKDRPPSEDALEGKAVEAVENRATKVQIVKRVAQLVPRVERTDGETKVGRHGQGIVHVKVGARSQEKTSL